MTARPVQATPSPEHSEAWVQPICNVEEVAAIRQLLAGRLRDLTLFSLGVNNALRAGDLLRITVNQVRDLQPGDTVEVIEKRTATRSLLNVPPKTHRVLQRYLQELSPPSAPGNMYLFAPQASWSPLTTACLDALVRDWTTEIGLKGTYGAHTLRKTFGYIQHTRYGVSLEVLARKYHHDAPLTTRRYLCINGDKQAEPLFQEI